jgi:O-antigen ligase
MFDKGDLVIPWVHNLYLEAWHDQGLMGLLPLIALTLLPMLRALRIEDRNVRTMILASMVTFILVALVEVTLTRRFYFAFLALFYGLALGQTKESRNEQSN